MRVDDQRWVAIADSFSAAAVGETSWLEGLSGLAAATGSRSGQLIGLGAQSAVPFNWVTDLGPDWVEDFAAVGGGDPEVNPFVRAGLQARVLDVHTSAEFVTSEDRRTVPFLAEHAALHDIQHICLTPLIKEPGFLVGLAVIRSGSEGEIDAAGRRLFASIAPHVRAAARTQLALEHQGALLVAGALEALSMAVFVCDARGAVRAMTPAAEALVSDGRTLRSKGGRLCAVYPEQTHELDGALRLAAAGLQRPGAPLSHSMMLGDALHCPLALEIVPLPRRAFAFGFEPRALVIARGLRTNTKGLQTLLRAAYGLTSAEADIAMRLGEGQPPEAIATVRNASLGTVRAQIRAVYAKLAVHNFNELIGRLKQLS